MRFTLFVVISVLSSAISGCSEYKGEIWLFNKTTKPIAQATIEVCAQTISFEGLEPGGSQHSTFLVKGECHYTVDVSFSDKSTILRNVGYLTSGFDYVDYLIVTDKEILLNPEGNTRKVSRQRS